MANTKGILRTTTPTRIWNIILLKVSFFLSNLLKKPIHWGMPMAVSIEPTTACNLRCPQCPSGLREFTRPTGNLKLSSNEQILNGLGKQLQYVNYYFQGEPFIHPNFLSLVKEARQRNIYTVASTNAHFITPEKAKEIITSGLSELIISIDGLTQEAYENYRREGELAKVIEGAKMMIEAKSKLNGTIHIVFQFLVTKKNEHQIDDLKSLATDLGINEVRLKTIQVYDLDGPGADLIPKNLNYSRYKQDDQGTFLLKNKFKNKCWRTWSSAVITWDGRVVPCCFDKDADHQFGNMLEKDFKNIWKSDVAHDFRKRLMRDRTEIEICKNCSEGSEVWL